MEAQAVTPASVPVLTVTSSPAMAPAKSDQNEDAVEETLKCGSLPLVPLPTGHHRLETDWTIWFDKKSKSKDVPFEDLVVELARFASLEQFWETFRWLKPVKDLARDSSYHVFRRSTKPMWENYVHGGCIIVKLKKNGEGIDALWHLLVAAAIGEYFEEPQIVGVGVGLRSKETCLSVWLATESLRVRTRLTEMIRVLLKVPVTSLEWKKHAVSMADQSTFRNAEKLSKKSRKSTKSEKGERVERTSRKSEKKSEKKVDKK